MDLYPSISSGFKLVDGPHFIGLSEVSQVAAKIRPHLLSPKSGSSRPFENGPSLWVGMVGIVVRESPFVEVTPFWCYIANSPHLDHRWTSTNKAARFAQRILEGKWSAQRLPQKKVSPFSIKGS